MKTDELFSNLVDWKSFRMPRDSICWTQSLFGHTEIQSNGVEVFSDSPRSNLVESKSFRTRRIQSNGAKVFSDSLESFLAGSISFRARGNLFQGGGAGSGLPKSFHSARN